MGSARGLLAGVVVSGTIIAGLVLTAGPAGALTTITVTSNGDAGGPCTPFPTSCTLRQAFQAAVTGGPAQGDDVEFVIQPAVGTISLAGQVSYDGGSGNSHALTIRGNGATVEGNNTFRLVTSSSAGLLTIDHLTLTKGTTAGNGGAISSAGALSVVNSRFIGNSAGGNGGALSSGGAVSVTDSTFTGNHAGSNGGAIGTGATMTVTNSTFTGNTAGNDAGAIGADATMTVVNSTFTDNTAGAAGGAIRGATGVTVAVVYSTFTGNGAASGSSISAEAINLFGSVFVKPAGTAALCAGASTSSGYNYANETANSCNLVAAGDSSNDANDPKLAALADNGGPTPTRLPLSGSPLIDAIPNAACGDGDALAGFAVTTDQRHLRRPDHAGGACDIGAVEVRRATEHEDDPDRAPTAPPVVMEPTFTG
jgi:predicted outer membrane repeat protein